MGIGSSEQSLLSIATAAMLCGCCIKPFVFVTHPVSPECVASVLAYLPFASQFHGDTTNLVTCQESSSPVSS